MMLPCRIFKNSQEDFTYQFIIFKKLYTLFDTVSFHLYTRATQVTLYIFFMTKTFECEKYCFVFSRNIYTIDDNVLLKIFRF